MLEQRFDCRGAMTVREFCLWAAIGRTLVYREIGSGRLRTVKLGKRRLVLFADALDWIRSLRDQSRTGPDVALRSVITRQKNTIKNNTPKKGRAKEGSKHELRKTNSKK